MRPPQEAGRDALVAAGADAVRWRKLVDAATINGGLWFDDPACRAEVGVPGEVGSAKLDAFARCLAGLQLEASPRASALGDVVVMRYAPGFEIEARVLTSTSGVKLSWIGYASRRAGDLDVPTITHDALERLRLAGDRNGPLDPAVASELDAERAEWIARARPPGRMVTVTQTMNRTGSERVTTTPSEPLPQSGSFAWIKVCLDESGAVVFADPFEMTSRKAAVAFAAAARTWKFRPFVTRGTPLRVCSMVRMAYPPDAAVTETLPMPPPPSRSKKRPLVFAAGSMGIELRRKSGQIHVLPDDLTKMQIADAGITKVTGTFRVCVDDRGLVESTLPLRVTGFSAYDAKIMRVMKTWVYEPVHVEGEPMPACTYVIIHYSQGSRPVRVQQH